MPRRFGRALASFAEDICELIRRADERRKLSELSLPDWRDLGIHQVREELLKRPWQD
jgi:uncharacterized protein YjiS (DUF1127 family)